MSQAVTPGRRNRIIERDKGICYLCNAILADNFIVIDHVIPRSRGGTNADNNLAVACVDCDKRKGDHLLSELEWVSDKVKSKYATLKRERWAGATRIERAIIFCKRFTLAVLALTTAKPSRLDDLIRVAKRN